MHRALTRVHDLLRSHMLIAMLVASIVVATVSGGTFGAIASHRTNTHNQHAGGQGQAAPESPTKSTTPNSKTKPPAPLATFAAAPSWQQDFSSMQSGAFNNSAWRAETDPAVPSYNDEVQAYTNNDPSNIYIKDGALVIQARKTPYTYPNDPQHTQYNYTSARIDTRNSFSFEYGKLEARIKMPSGKGTWPAWWMLSANQINTAKLKPSAADWANERFYMHDGELDAIEHYGQFPNTVEGTLYTFNKTYQYPTPLADSSDVYHTYGVEVTPQKVSWTIDGKQYASVNRPSASTDDWPIGGGNKWYVILNLALGGSGGGAVDDSTESHWVMQTQYVKYYPYQGPL